MLGRKGENITETWWDDSPSVFENGLSFIAMLIELGLAVAVH